MCSLLETTNESSGFSLKASSSVVHQDCISCTPVAPVMLRLTIPSDINSTPNRHSLSPRFIGCSSTCSTPTRHTIDPTSWTSASSRDLTPGALSAIIPLLRTLLFHRAGNGVITSPRAHPQFPRSPFLESTSVSRGSSFLPFF